MKKREWLQINQHDILSFSQGTRAARAASTLFAWGELTRSDEKQPRHSRSRTGFSEAAFAGMRFSIQFSRSKNRFIRYLNIHKKTVSYFLSSHLPLHSSAQPTMS